MGWLLQQCGDLQPKTSPRDGLKRSQSDLILKSSSVSAVSILHSGSQGFVLNFVFLGGSVVSMIPSSTILPVSFRKRLEPKAATLSE